MTVCGKGRAPWSKRAPIVAMCGQWLCEAGFPIGTRVSVEVELKRLVLTAVGHAAQGD